LTRINGDAATVCYGAPMFKSGFSVNRDSRRAIWVAAGVSLAQARELLAARAVRGLQLRYRYDGAEWWDTS
jgi:hypothetical protein